MIKTYSEIMKEGQYAQADARRRMVPNQMTAGQIFAQAPLVKRSKLQMLDASASRYVPEYRAAKKLLSAPSRLVQRFRARAAGKNY